MQNKLKFKRIILAIFYISIAAFFAVTIWENLTVGSTHYEVSSERLPDGFDGYIIAQISDLHNARFGEDNSQIIRILEKEKPNLIVITGDLIDSNDKNIDNVLYFAEQAMEIAPCYYVTGNHEAWVGGDYDALEEKLQETGVVILHDEAITLSEKDDTIRLIGLDDPDFTNRKAAVQMHTPEAKLKNLNLQNGFKLLLSHRPEAFNTYVAHDIDLVLTGHAHGGQFRIPFIGGVVAPNQGLFPSYDAGEYHEGNTTMIVSRGIGNSVIPVRINNRPEVVIVELRAEPLHKILR